MRRIVWSSLPGKDRRSALSRPAHRDDGAIQVSVRAIIDDVRARGDAALRQYTLKFDKADLSSLRVSAAEMDAAERSIEPRIAGVIKKAYDNIYAFHAAQGFKEYKIETAPGVACARKAVPVGAVGLYVPGGTAPLVSTTLMTGIPSKIAGCSLRVMCTPCGADGAVDPYILYAARLCGIDTVFKLGGAQAIAAMAFGTETVPSVDKIFGPGNAYVTAAKKMVSGDPGGAAMDMPAGPSEVCVIADDATNPVFAAADLLSQAEHDTLSQVVLITLSEAMRQKIQEQVEKQLATLPRRGIAAQALENSLAIIADNLEQAVEISNLYAPEHLILCFEGAEKYAGGVRNAGSVFVGPWSTESAGDYCSGPNHSLPTYGYAHAYSGLSVEAFQKTMSVQTLTREGLAGLGDTITTLAGLEGLEAHARAVTLRLEGKTT